MLSEQSNKSWGLRTMELIAIFFVNAIACKKRFCSPILQFQPEGSCAISSILWFGILSPHHKISELYRQSQRHRQERLMTTASEKWHFGKEWCVTVIIPFNSISQMISKRAAPFTFARFLSFLSVRSILFAKSGLESRKNVSKRFLWGLFLEARYMTFLWLRSSV